MGMMPLPSHTATSPARPPKATMFRLRSAAVDLNDSDAEADSEWFLRRLCFDNGDSNGNGKGSC